MDLIVPCLELGGGHVPDRAEQPPIVEPVDPFQGRKLDLLEISPGSAAMNEFGLIDAEGRLGQGVVVGIADAADRRLDATSASRSV